MSGKRFWPILKQVWACFGPKRRQIADRSEELFEIEWALRKLVRVPPATVSLVNFCHTPVPQLCCNPLQRFALGQHQECVRVTEKV